MPKATKKQKEKAADFSKAKLKLGKGKQVANNATDTSYKARSIALPTQNPLLRSLRDPDLSNEVPTSHRGLTISEVLVVLRHTNASARKEGLNELKEVLVDGMKKGVALGKREGEVGLVVRAFLGLIMDEESSVRKALLAFLNWYLPVLPSDAIQPHLPIILLQTSSALSHIYPEIRLDACRLVSLLLTVSPSSVVSSWPYPSAQEEKISGQGKNGDENVILQGLWLAAGIGGRAGEGGGMGHTFSPGSKLVVLKTLMGFIQAGLRKQGMLPLGNCGAADGSGTMGVSAKELRFPEEIFERFEPIYQRTRHPLSIAQGSKEKEISLKDLDRLDVLGGIDGWLFGPTVGDELEATGFEIGRRGGLDGGQEEVDVGEVLSTLFLYLNPLLLSSLLESAPTAFGLSPQQSFGKIIAGPDVHLSICSAILEIVVALGGEVLRNHKDTKEFAEVRKAVAMIVGKMSAYFPFGNLGEIRGQRMPAGFAEMQESVSVAYSILVVLLRPTPGKLPARPKNANVKYMAGVMEQAFRQVSSAKNSKEQAALAGVAGWLVDLLSTNADPLRPALSPHVYVRTLPVIWSLMSSFSFVPTTDGDESIPEMMLRAVLEHLSRCGTETATKRLGTEFIARMILLHENRTPLYPFYIPANSVCRSLLSDWLESLPKALWELGDKDSYTTQIILNFLLWLGHHDDSFFSAKSKAHLRSRLGPYFWIEHPTKGAMTGPWARLSDRSIRMLALSVAALWSNESQDLRVSVDRATANFDAYEAAHWIRITSTARISGL